MRRASELKDQPKSERRRPAPSPEEVPQVEEQPQPEEEEAEEQSNLMELFVAFDGGIRGSTAQGHGRYLVQAPGRKAIVKSAEFDANFTPAQAQYEALIEGLRYIGARLEATGRTPQQVQLDIRSDNEGVVNGLLGTMKVKEPALKKRQEQALSLLATFADWRIEWHSPEESARLLG
jgi:ribonuclease HI